MNPTVGLRSHPNQPGFAPIVKINKPTATEIKLVRIRKYEIPLVRSPFMLVNSFVGIVTNCHPGYFQHLFRHNHASSTLLKSSADRLSSRAQAESIADQIRHQNPS